MVNKRVTYKKWEKRFRGKKTLQKSLSERGRIIGVDPISPLTPPTFSQCGISLWEISSTDY
ncbi:hypothetical protein T12_12809 [Trichinella patagoniensis]|uniref:Uncharacterized protein n=1 Tax=Trichinella patagoniensis TaxID=990121 RepID=A0A0V1AH80_9BILA|nr:hypothetical protein T12_12809 [Trichinella patagoniensis]